MRTIIIAGKPRPKLDKQDRLKCPECGCVFAYEYDDIEAEDRPCSQPYVVCPQKGCGHEVNVMRNKHPDNGEPKR